MADLPIAVWIVLLVFGLLSFAWLLTILIELAGGRNHV